MRYLIVDGMLKLCDRLAWELPGNKIESFSAAWMENLKSA